MQVSFRPHQLPLFSTIQFMHVPAVIGSSDNYQNYELVHAQTKYYVML